MPAGACSQSPTTVTVSRVVGVRRGPTVQNLAVTGRLLLLLLLLRIRICVGYSCVWWECDMVDTSLFFAIAFMQEVAYELSVSTIINDLA